MIIAGRGVAVSPSRLKWKIALHTLANTSAASCVSPPDTHPLIPQPLYPRLSGCAGPLGRTTPVSSPNPLGWFLLRLSLVCRVLGVVCCFIPCIADYPTEVRAVNVLYQAACLAGRLLVVVLYCGLCQTRFLNPESP